MRRILPLLAVVAFVAGACASSEARLCGSEDVLRLSSRIGSS
jgi:hypothetical protein